MDGTLHFPAVHSSKGDTAWMSDLKFDFLLNGEVLVIINRATAQIRGVEICDGKIKISQYIHVSKCMFLNEGCWIIMSHGQHTTSLQ